MSRFFRGERRKKEQTNVSDTLLNMKGTVMNKKDQCSYTDAEKKEWGKPKLTVYGTVEKITQGCDPKAHGPSDGITTKAPPIHCAS